MDRGVAALAPSARGRGELSVRGASSKALLAPGLHWEMIQR
jgi:hypothetical protein